MSSTPNAPDCTEHLQRLLKVQKDSFLHDGVPDLATRLDRLKRLERMLLDHEDDIVQTLSQDFQGRSRHLTRAADIVGGISAIRHTIEHLPRWLEPQPLELPQDVAHTGTTAAVHYRPVGVVGVVVPWNGPVLLTCLPLMGILAAGNRAMVKVSEFAPAAASLLSQMVARTFAPEEVAIVEGAADVASAFTRLPFDHLLFTGSTQVAKYVMRAAAESLTPVTLELGGKSPVICGRTAQMDETAARLAHGKLAFGGQVCVTPDYVLASAGQERALAEKILAEAALLYPTIHGNDDYSAIINEAHLRRLQGLLEDARAKGATLLTVPHIDRDAEGCSRKFPLTVVLNASDDMKVMQEEIFGPILPILPYDTVHDALAYIRARPNPLSAYYFGQDADEQALVTRSIQTGGLLVNDVLCQIFYENIPFGGSGASGMGRYRGAEGFKTFSNGVSVFVQKQPEALLQQQRPPYGSAMQSCLDARVEQFRHS
ncbi:coniferyl-aldehyde dehydrogenase [Variovorax boronicumulans]|uniref:aldehyde dehydrogenase family protein n=1 Tax=Variovorax boronicumulans TaxID=436515 RepID=UPI002781BD94|nr:aldehyde dehydrogenase family protein [Variovorax boronicumulans]MDP9920567.1 coniferyl-aldehyde dehydrogenase [Variovorax boronicumulans]